MKTPKFIAALIALASTFSFSGCVDPYHGGEVAVTSTTYQPGYVVTGLPHGYRTEVVSGVNYYNHGDVYYRQQGRGYVVVDSPHRHGPRNEYRNDYHSERVVRQLPSGYQVVTHGGTRYYRAGNVYYQPRGEGYIVVRSPF